MLALAQGGWTASQVLTELRGRRGARRWSFRYELLDSTNQLIGDLDNVVESCTVRQNWLADIKRTAQFAIRDTGEIDFLSDRIKPYVRLGMPPYGDTDWVEWPQGVFLLSTPTRKATDAGALIRDVEAYDQCQVYVDDKVSDRYTVDVGAVYTDAILTLLGSIDLAVTPSVSVLPAAKEWDPGTPKLTIINSLLNALNYQSLSFDEDGRAVICPYTSPADRVPEYTYADDEDSLIVPGVEQTYDLFSVPNKWILVVSDPDQTAIVGEHTNSDPSSPTSTVRRGRTIVDFRTGQDAADQATLTAQAERLAFEASQVFENISFDTGMMPIHSGNDVYTLEYDPLQINAKYSEHSWEMPLRAGSRMRHVARRVVTVG